MLYKVQTTYTSLELQTKHCKSKGEESSVLPSIAGQRNAHVAFH